MVVKEYDRAHTFLEENEVALLEREAVSQVILYNAYQSRNINIVEKGIFGVVKDEEKTILLFCNLIPHNLVICVANQENAVVAAAFLADYLGNSRVMITGINARNDVCVSFMEQYKKHINCSFTEKVGTDIMEIRKVNDIKPVEGSQRLAELGDLKLIAEWMIEYQIEALTNEMDYEAALKKATKYIDEDRIYLYENDEHQVVSMAIAARKLVHGMAITYVFTPEIFRGKGYAAANMYYLSRELLEQGFSFCTLFVDKKNPLSSRAYEKV
ncbi:MAG TPA: GNAT family N-acetyltransferase, partial [Mobilitalea sp.]|nr:GNAT family N-acetyltransferase [Mobilitalea sp.]